MTNHCVPANRPIKLGQGRDRPKGAGRVKFKAAVTTRHEHAVNPCRLESRNELLWQSPVLLHAASVLRDDRRKRTDARKHLIQRGLIGILDLADYRPLLVEKRCHLAILLQVRSGKRQSCAGKLRHDYGSRGIRFKRNRTGLAFLQRACLLSYHYWNEERCLTILVNCRRAELKLTRVVPTRSAGSVVEPFDHLPWPHKDLAEALSTKMVTAG